MVSKRINASVSDWPLFVDGGGRGMQHRALVMILISGRLKLKEYKTDPYYFSIKQKINFLSLLTYTPLLRRLKLLILSFSDIFPIEDLWPIPQKKGQFHEIGHENQQILNCHFWPSKWYVFFVPYSGPPNSRGEGAKTPEPPI